MAKIVQYTVKCDSPGCEQTITSEIHMEDALAEAGRLFWQIDTVHGEGIEDRCPEHTEREV